MKVFVYGTLKRGYGNNAILCHGDAEFIQEDAVVGYRLYNSGFPVARESEGTAIYGEVWDIGDTNDPRGADTLRRLDALEGVSHGMYRRDIVTTLGGHECGMYVGPEGYWPFQRMNECPSDIIRYPGDEMGEFFYTTFVWSR